MVFIAACLCLVGCGGGAHDARLTAINDSADVNPKWSVAALDSLDVDALSDRDRHYYDLLTVKARDKAYITHTSDSLILSVIDYYRSRDSRHLPEALYYGGRVYSDLGDYPTALTYFQDALDVTPADDINLLGRLNSQTGRLLNAIRQFHLAIPYLKESLRFDSIKKDTFALAFNNQLLSSNYVDIKMYDSASYFINKAVNYSKFLTAVDKADINIYKGAVEYRKGNLANAAKIIFSNMNSASKTFRWLAQKYACDIYYNERKYDSVYYYARQLCNAPIHQNQKSGYTYLFKPQVKKYLPIDSIETFFEKYSNLVENYLNRYDAESTLWQNTRYNYNLHVQEKIKAENSKLKLQITVFICIICALVLAFIVLWFKYKDKRSSAQLQEALVCISELKQKLLNTDTENKLDSLREQLKDNLKKYKSIKRSTRPVIELDIVDSDVVQRINELIKKGKHIPDSSSLWNEIEDLVATVSPNFKTSILTLTNNQITTFDMHLLYLIRCGMTPGQLEILLGRSMGTISTHRIILSERIMNEKLGNKYFDLIISSI